jgi:peptide/nickel transport system permease protein
LTTGFLVVFLAVLIGAPLGAVAGYFGGRVDDVIMRITDVFLSFPPCFWPLPLPLRWAAGLSTP